MKFLFVVQGEGRGHLTQAIALEEMLRRNGHEVVEVLVGKSNLRSLPGFFNRQIEAPVRRFYSPNFLPTPANKRVGLFRSVVYNLLRIPVYVQSMRFIRDRICESGADMVINFYELLTGLTYQFLSPNIPYICVGHQYLFRHSSFSMPAKHYAGLFLLNFFTRLTALGARQCLALSFQTLVDCPEKRIRVVPPLLRREVLLTESSRGNYIHGYMVNAGFGVDIADWHVRYPHVPLRFFWDKSDEPQCKQIDETLCFYQLDDFEFLRQMAGCKAYATTAGFESVCEAMYLGKPMLMVPAHIEQDCNAYDAARNGAGIVSNGFEIDKLIEFCEVYEPNREFVRWVRSSERLVLSAIEEIAFAPLYCVRSVR